MKIKGIFFLVLSVLFFTGCRDTVKDKEVWAEDILGNTDYQAISYGGYRHDSREKVPSIEELKEDMHILSALGIKILRTYNTQDFDQARRLLQAIDELKREEPGFEMYVMLGAWIKCKDANSPNPDHSQEDLEFNTAEINAAVYFAKKYPDIVKIIAVGNEAMVHWATSYFVEPGIILKWVNYLQDLKQKDILDDRLWITSSDNFASWGGGDESYHKEDLIKLINAVDFVSLHTYPYHDTHYNPSFWGVLAEEMGENLKIQVDSSMNRAIRYAKMQYKSVVDYMDGLGVKKSVHIGETGWSTTCNTKFGDEGSRAADQYKQKLYYDAMRSWTNNEGISCFYFEAFDEPWKDGSNPEGSENHFGLFTVDGKAKFLLWGMVDKGVFEGLQRGGKPVQKTFDGDISSLESKIKAPPLQAHNNLKS